jgi:hypothetical protein
MVASWGISLTVQYLWESGLSRIELGQSRELSTPVRILPKRGYLERKSRSWNAQWYHITVHWRDGSHLDGLASHGDPKSSGRAIANAKDRGSHRLVAARMEVGKSIGDDV